MNETLEKAMNDGIIRYASVAEIAGKLSLLGLTGQEKIEKARALHGKILAWRDRFEVGKGWTVFSDQDPDRKLTILYGQEQIRQLAEIMADWNEKHLRRA